MSAEDLLSRLEGVRQTGPDQYIARCPSHDDRTPSLSIRELPDGVVLLNDFGGCAAAEVVAAVGLTLADLFPEPLPDRGPLRHGQRRVAALDALRVIDHEALTVSVIASDIRQHREVDDETWKRLATAAARIGEAREIAR